VVADAAPTSRGRTMHPRLPRWRPPSRKPDSPLEEGEEGEEGSLWASDALVPLSLTDTAATDEPDWVFALRWAGKGNAGALHARLQEEPSEPRLASDGTPLRARHRRTPFSGDVSALAASARRAVVGRPAHRRAISHDIRHDCAAWGTLGGALEST